MRELKRLNKFLLKYKGKLLLGLLITIISRVFSIVTPRLVGDSMTTIENYLSLNSISSDDLKDVLFFIIVLIIGASLISGFFTFLMRLTIINVSRFIEFDVKNEIFSHYQSLDQIFYKKNRTGDLMNRISEDVSKVRMYYGPVLMYGTNAVVLFVIIIFYMYSVAPKLTIYSLIPLPILSVFISDGNQKEDIFLEDINIPREIKEHIKSILTYHEKLDEISQKYHSNYHFTPN